MSETIEFLSPRLIGARFDGHSIPLEVLKDLSVLEDLIVEVAKWHYRRDNPGRKRIPKGFAEEVSLKVSEIESGSAVPIIVLSISSVSDRLFPVDHREYFEKAKESIVHAVDSAEKGESVTDILHDSHLAYFDRIGRSLRDDESFELNYPDSARPARLNKPTRRYLTLAAKSQQAYTEEITVRGGICEADQRKDRFQLQLADGQIIEAPIQAEHRETILEAFGQFLEGTRVMIDAVGRYNRQGRIESLESLEHINLLDPLDVGARLDEFRSLKDGWLEGKGFAPRAEGLNWLTTQFESNYSDQLPLPLLFPTGEGGIQAEWRLKPWEVSLDIQLETKLAYWHALNLQTDEEEDRQMDLSALADWKWVTEKVAAMQGGAA